MEGNLKKKWKMTSIKVEGDLKKQKKTKKMEDNLKKEEEEKRGQPKKIEENPLFLKIS